MPYSIGYTGDTPPPCTEILDGPVSVVTMSRFPMPPAAACVLAIAVLVLVVFLCVWISIGGGPWEQFYSVLEIWSSIDSSVTSDPPAQRSARAAGAFTADAVALKAHKAADSTPTTARQHDQPDIEAQTRSLTERRLTHLLPTPGHCRP